MATKQDSRSSVAFSVNAKLNFRIIIVGDSAVGKTSLVLKYVKGIFHKNYTVSLGVQFYSKVINIDNEEVVLQIWDTAGQENFKSIVKSFYNKASCVIIAYSDPQILASTLDNYTLEINEHALDGVRVMVARTQLDERPLTQAETNFLEQAVKDGRIDVWMGVSSKTGQNVQDFFDQLAHLLFKFYHQNQQFREIVDPKKNSFKLGNDDAQKDKQSDKKSCC